MKMYIYNNKTKQTNKQQSVVAEPFLLPSKEKNRSEKTWRKRERVSRLDS